MTTEAEREQRRPQQQTDFKMSQLGPVLIHRVLLTDRSELSSLTVTGRPVQTTTPSFEEFASQLSSKETQQSTVQAAYRDHLREVIMVHHSMEPMQRMMLELYSLLRRLVPNRKDLHRILSDSDAQKLSSPDDVFPLLSQAARVLRKLESVARAESTQKWIELSSSLQRRADASDKVSFLLTSIMYLMFKTELCQADKQNFFLSTIIAPKIHENGVNELRRLFEAKYGNPSDPTTAPLTRQWVQALLERSSSSRRDLLQSKQARRDLIRKGWVNAVLFRGPNASRLLLPEVLMWEMDSIRSIREHIRRAAAGSSLALHASTMAEQPSSVLSEEVSDATSPIRYRRQDLLHSMVPKTNQQSDYERTVADAVVALARTWRADISNDKVEKLTSRTKAVLAAKDPVVSLLDKRMKDVFEQMIVKSTVVVVVPMRSGCAKPTETRRILQFEKEAEAEFCRQGMAFYASELAGHCYRATKSIELVEKLYGELLDRIILEECA